jgi:hypothetical protein
MSDISTVIHIMYTPILFFIAYNANARHYLQQKETSNP